MHATGGSPRHPRAHVVSPYPQTEGHVATFMPFEEQLREVEAMASASSGRQDMLAGNLRDVRDMVSRLEDAQRETQTWQNITAKRLDIVGKRVVAISAGVTNLND